MMVWKMILLFYWVNLRFHVFRGVSFLVSLPRDPPSPQAVQDRHLLIEKVAPDQFHQLQKVRDGFWHGEMRELLR